MATGRTQDLARATAPPRPMRFAQLSASCAGQARQRLQQTGSGLRARPGASAAQRRFDADEQEAILLAAARDLSWAVAGQDSDEWKVRLIPLDQAAPSPPGFNNESSSVWESVTPYVSPRHHIRGGKERERESLAEQIRRELRLRGFSEQVEVELVGRPTWVSAHIIRREAHKRASIGNRRGQTIRLRFSAAVTGPIRLGHSSTFGLGLFRPVSQ